MRNHIFIFCLLYLSSCVQREEPPIVGHSHLGSSTERLIKTTVINKDTIGEWHSYHENGKVFSKFYTKNNQVNGPFTSYHENGWVFTVGNYDKGVQSGTWISYWGPNRIANVGNYRMGEKNGIWNYYFLNGNLEKTIEYSDGREAKISIDNSVPIPK